MFASGEAGPPFQTAAINTAVGNNRGVRNSMIHPEASLPKRLRLGDENVAGRSSGEPRGLSRFELLRERIRLKESAAKRQKLLGDHAEGHVAGAQFLIFFCMAAS